jgi:hypothetical protein
VTKGNRIIYAKITPTKYMSVAVIPTAIKGDVRVFYDLADKTYRITSSLGTEVYAEGREESRHMILRKIREHLDNFGSSLSKESRRKRLTPEEQALRLLKNSRKGIKRIVPVSKEELEEEIRKLTSEITLLRDEKKYGT